MSTQLEPRITRREDAESIRPFGIEMKVMMAAAQTSDTCSVLIGELKPGEGPPPHLHRGFDEYFFVLEGTISLVVRRQAKHGDPRQSHFHSAGRNALVHEHRCFAR